MSDRNERSPGATFTPATISGLIDFETSSQSVDLPAAGTYAYVADAHATVLAYALGDGDVRTAVAREYHAPLHWRDMPDEIGHFHSRVLRGEAIWCAWNAPFDRAVWNYSTVGFPALAAHHIIDAAAQGAAAGLPRDLAGAGRICGTRKLETGKALIKLFSIPGATATPASHPKEWAEFLLYARQDVEALRTIFRRMLQWPLAEWRESSPWRRSTSAAFISNRHGHVRGRARCGGPCSQRRRAVDAHGRCRHHRALDEAHGELPDGAAAARRRSILTLREEQADEDGVTTRRAKHSLNRHCATHLIAYCSALLADPPPRRTHQRRSWLPAETPDQALRRRRDAGQVPQALAQRTGDAV